MKNKNLMLNSALKLEESGVFRKANVKSPQLYADKLEFKPDIVSNLANELLCVD